MSKHFQVGEIVLVVGALKHPENVGKEVEIVAPLKERIDTTGQRYLCYGIRTPDGKLWGAMPEHLWKRKGRPRRGSWNECPFKPVGVRT